MLVFYTQLLFNTIFSFVVLNCRISKKMKLRILCLILITSFVLVCGLRYDVGSDYNQYNDIFLVIKSGNIQIRNSNGLEIGFILLNQFIIFLKGNYNALLFLVSAISILGIFVGTRYFSKDEDIFVLSIIVFTTFGLYGSLFNTIRQGLTIGIFSIALIFAYKKKLLIYIGLIALAWLFHSSAIIMFPIYFIVNFNIKKWIYYVLPIVCLFIKFSGLVQVIYYRVLNWSFFSDKYSQIYSSGVNVDNGYGIKYIIIIGIFYYILLFFWNSILKKDEKFELQFKLLLIYFSLSIFASEVWIIYRVALLFSVSMVLTAPKLLYLFKLKNKYLVKILFFVFFAIYYYFELKTHNALLPYQSILSI